MFNRIHEGDKSFDNQKEIYNNLRVRLLNLSEDNPILYRDLIKGDYFNDPIEIFLGLENEILPKLEDSPISETYNEVEIATNQEKDVWSDRAPSPPLSPQYIEKTVMETIEKDEPKSPAIEFWEKLKNKNQW